MKRYSQDSRFRGNDNNKSLVVIGPTSSGKSDLAVALAQEFSGEVISADSRQVFRGLDVGSGKITAQEQCGVPHHILDVANAQDDYNVTHFLNDAKIALQEIHSRNHVPIVCGGTGFWIQALVEGQQLPEVPPNKKLRKTLEKKSTGDLYAELQKKDPERAKSVDHNNKIRLIRALEVVKKIGTVPSLKSIDYKQKANQWCILALCPPKDILHERIKKRLEKRLRGGMVEETQSLHRGGLSWERLESFGLEYKWTALFVQKKATAQEMHDGILAESRQYAKRQMTWLKRWERHGARLHWLNAPEEAESVVKTFLQS